jgi:hypothetical protein
LGDVRVPWRAGRLVGFGKNVPNVRGTLPKGRQSPCPKSNLEMRMRIDKKRTFVSILKILNKFKNSFHNLSRLKTMEE